MNNENVTINTVVNKSELIKHIKTPCFGNWKRIVENDMKHSICHECPFRESLKQFVDNNRDYFTPSQLSIFDQYRLK